MLADKNHIVSTGPDMSRFFFSVSDAVTLVCAAMDNMEMVSGKILSLPMKGTELRRILNVWTNMTGASWSLGEKRPGDRELEYLLSTHEGERTTRIELSGNPYFLLDPKSISSIPNAIGTEFSSQSAIQFTDAEIEQLILNPPADRFL
jgi:FlaA1/EpsC-like NDP-sugar epimerase